MENLPTPLSRVELYLAKACGMDVTVPEQPLSRLEQFLAILAGDTSITMPTPMSLTEQWLAYVLGATPDPLLAVEGACLIGAQKVDVRYFAVAASMPGATLPEAPQNRAEMYWAHIAGNPPTPGILKYVTGKYFYLTDVVSGIEELQYVKGDTYQQTYSGKNLFNGEYVQYAVGGSLNNIWFSNASTRSAVIKCQPNTIYTITKFDPSNRFVVADYPSVPPSNTQINTLVINNTATTLTVTTNSDAEYLFIYVSGQNEEPRMQVELGSSPTSYEPYVGGIPAPNPDYPQTVNVVTGVQNVWVHKKNLINSAETHNSINSSGAILNGDQYLGVTEYVPCEPNTVYAASFQHGTSDLNLYVGFKDNNGNFIIRNGYGTLRTFTTPENATSMFFYMTKTGATPSIGGYAMLEYGSTVSPFEPYQGQSYTIDLGSIELCNIGNYQDKIFNNDPNEDWYDPDLEDNAWYVHKEVVKISPNGTEKWKTTSSPPPTGQFYVYTSDFDSIVKTKWYSGLVSDNFTMWRGTPGWLTPITIVNGAVFSNSDSSGAAALRIMFPSSIVSSVETAKTWFASNLPVFYYPIATSTDTKITDATLISELDALNSAPLPKPIASIALGATGTNLTPYLTIAYYGSDEE